MTSDGAHWVRAALQVNPYAYEGRNAPKNFFANEEDYNEALLDECQVQQISLIAITDHWCVDSARGLVDAAAARGIVALPGFEANSSEGIHVLVIFEAEDSYRGPPRSRRRQRRAGGDAHDSIRAASGDDDQASRSARHRHHADNRRD